MLEQLQWCLDLQWRNTEQALETDAENSDETITSRLAPETLDSLRRFASMGYLKGVTECIEIFESQYAQSAWVNKIKTLSEQCDLNRIVHVIDELTESKGKEN